MTSWLDNQSEAISLKVVPDKDFSKDTLSSGWNMESVAASMSKKNCLDFRHSRGMLGSLSCPMIDRLRKDRLRRYLSGPTRPGYGSAELCDTGAKAGKRYESG